MTDRERLIELLDDCRYMEGYGIELVEKQADHLLENGVIVGKQGEWQVHQSGEYWHYDCPFCDDGYATRGKDITPNNYCGNCGAMLKEREHSDR